MFEADRPIVNTSQDRLGRGVFAKYLARAMLDHTAAESLVLGLYGSWGVGKTSLIHLILEELRFAASNMLDDEKPIILNFSPWSYSGQNQLIYNFFRRLSSEIKQSSNLQDKEKIVHLLELYVSFFTRSPVPIVFRPKKPLRQKIFGRKSKTKPLEEVAGWESGHDLTNVKAELNELLRRQKHKIIIIIDNISQIEPTEIKQIFQIVKSMGDYANTIYLLSMDKKSVVQAINKLYEGEGENYLQKIVQLSFEIPAMTGQDIETLFFDKLEKIVSTLPDDRWEKKRWADIYYASLRHFFKNYRDITRYLNTLSFGLSRVKEVINPVDYFALTALEVFEPAVFEGIRDNKDLFTDLMNTITLNDPNKLAKDKLRSDEILNRARCISKEHLKQLLIYLFPRLLGIYETHLPFYHSESIARQNRRICSFDLFDVYFRLSLSSGIILPSEFDAILSLVTSFDNFDLALTRLNQDERIAKFLGLLDSIDSKKIQTTDIPIIIDALIDNGDLFPEGENNQLTFNTPDRIHRIIHQLLNRYDTSEQRFEIMRIAIKKSVKSIYSIVHELTAQSEDHDETTDTFIPVEHRDFTPTQLEDLKKLALEKINEWADNGRLNQHPQLNLILKAWKMWGGEEACKRFVIKMVETDLGLLTFLVNALKEPVSSAMITLQINGDWDRFIVNIEEFIPSTKIIPHAKEMFEEISFDKMREKEQLALLIFLNITKTMTTKVIPKTTI